MDGSGVDRSAATPAVEVTTPVADRARPLLGCLSSVLVTTGPVPVALLLMFFVMGNRSDCYAESAVTFGLFLDLATLVVAGYALLVTALFVRALIRKRSSPVRARAGAALVVLGGLMCMTTLYERERGDGYYACDRQPTGVIRVER